MRIYLLPIICILANVYCNTDISVEAGDYIDEVDYYKYESGEPTNGGGSTIVDIIQSGGEYVGEIGIGSPEQKIQVYIDTLSSYIVVRSCLSFQGNCYDIHNSTTEQELSEDIAKLSKTAQFSVTETVSVGNLTVQQQHLLAVVNRANKDVKTYGFLGLAFCSNSTDKQYVLFGKDKYSMDRQYSILHKMVNEGVLKKNVFCLYFNSWIRPDKAAKVGELLLGDSDSNQYKGNLTYVNNISKSVWKIKMNSVSMSDNILCKSCEAHITSNEYYISAPKYALTNINKIINAFPTHTPDLYSVKCNTVPRLADFIIQLGEQKFILKGEDYTFKVGEVCYTAFSTSEKKHWALGITFLSRVYSQFEMVENRIGFAERKFTS